MAPAQNGIQQYVKLEERLVLLAWLNDLFGYKSNRDLLPDMKEAAEEFDASCRSFVYHRLIAYGDKVRIAAADLARYDVRNMTTERGTGRSSPMSISCSWGTAASTIMLTCTLFWAMI